MQCSDHRRSGARGFTLIELMVVLMLGAVVSTSFFSIMYWQNLGYLERLDEVDAHQNGRATINLVRRYIRSARFGLASDANGAGFVAIGQCYSTSTPNSGSQNNCNNLAADANADRLRVAFLNNDTEFVANTTTASTHTCTTPGSAFVDTGKIRVAQNPVRAFSTTPLGAPLAGIGRPCMTGGSASYASDLFYVSGDSGAGDSGCLHRYTFTPYQGGSALSCGTSVGYAAGFTFGRATLADFYMRTISGTRMLMLRPDPRLALDSATVVGYDIEDFQVRYGIDTTTPPDRSLDAWCDDVRSTADGGTCALTDSTGTTLTTGAIYNRIMAVQATVRIRSTASRPNTKPFPLNPNFVAAAPVANINDGYQRWLYTTTVMLRNNNI